MSNLPESLKKEMDNFVKDISKKWDILFASKDVIKLVEGLNNLFPSLEIETNFDWWSKSPNFYIKNLMSFAEMVPVVSILEDEGYELQGKNDYPESGYRSYSFGSFIIFAFIKPESTRCIKVLVNEDEELVKRQTYKFVCLDEEAK